MKLTIESDIDKSLKVYNKKYKDVTQKALAKIGQQALTWMAQGSPYEQRTPPVLTGNLRASGSVFVGTKLVGDSSQWGITPSKDTERNNNQKDNVVTLSFGAVYAARVHETESNGGKYTKQSGDSGPHWVKKHLDADQEAYWKLLAIFLNKDLNKGDAK